MAIGRQAQVPFDAALKARMVDGLRRHVPLTLDPAGRRRAAVALIILDSDAELHGGDEVLDSRLGDLAQVPGVTDDVTGRVDGTAGGAAVLLTRRSAQLGSHARQWAMPGGRLDPGEEALHAAQREAAEEVGLVLGEDDVIGRLDDYPTRSGYVISPFVFWLSGAQEPTPNPDEVASVHRIGCHELLRGDSPRFVAIAESSRPVVQMAIGGDLIHAPTGAILYQFRAVALEGRSIRVDHLEQPPFAWE